MGPDDEGTRRSRSERRHAHHEEPENRLPARSKTPPPAWNDKTMHHPATRIGEIKPGKT
jgi:hypothetical protein